jgi:predicted metal-dependent hydrolase
VNIDEKTIVINGLAVKVIRKRIKNLHLAVYPPDGWVRIAVPEIIDDEAVRLAVISKFGWIKRQIKSFENQPRQSARELITGESHYYLGKRYLLDVSHTEKKPAVELKNKKTLTLLVKETTTLEQREQLLTDWYRKEMKRLLPGIIRKWEMKSELKVDAFGIKRMKTKWGSCSPTQKRIWLNLELIKKPISCLEYIVVHEMVHFLERTHNDKFVTHMDRIMPQWRTFRDDLNLSPLSHEDWSY